MLGILLVGFAAAAPNHSHADSYQPMDCLKAATVAQTTVCKNYALGQDEARQATLFDVLASLVAMGQRADLIDAQRGWIEVREACGTDTKCLSSAYKTRIEQLSQALDALAKKGPF
jgi:uncharacterized protein